MILVIYVLVLLEIWWDWRLIERKLRRPDYRGSNWLRLIVGFVLWVIWPLMVEVSHAQWLFSPVMMFFNFWFVFDYGLNKARGKKLIHLGTNMSDRLQREYGGELVWFRIKAGLAVISVVIYYWL